MGSIYRPKYKDRNGKKRESAVYWIQFCTGGKVHRESTETADLEEAKEYLIKPQGEALTAGSSPSKVTFGELAAAEISDYETNGRKTIEDLKARLDLHILPVFGSKKARDIRAGDITEYAAARLKEGAERGTVNRELTAIKRAFTLGIESEKIVRRPRIAMLEENNVRKGFFEQKQFDDVLKHLPDYAQDFIKFAFITGWRSSEIKNLQWRHVDFEAGLVRLDAGETKNDGGRIFPMTSDLRALLENRRAATDAFMQEHGSILPWVFWIKGNRIDNFKRSWAAACRKAGIPGKLLHDFRRTAARNFQRAGIPEATAMKLLGHKTPSVYRRYNIITEDDLREAAAKLEKRLPIDKVSDKVGG
jgi:integrase